jgi:[acyl-carrier-protein] S-malonyltransferase
MSKTGFIFPGQGAQHVGMGREIASRCPAARALFERADELLGFSLSKICFEGPQSELDKTDVSQPAIFVCSLAALEWLKVDRPQIVDHCSVAAGLSLGEYTALCYAGAFSFDDGVRLVRARGEAMQAAAEATPSGMVSVILLDVERVRELCALASEAGTIQIANLLCPGNTVVSGTKAACARLAELAEKAGGKPVPLAVAGAFHTDLMRPADERLAVALQQAQWHPPRIPVVSNVDALPHTDPAEFRTLLVRQVLSPVLWESSMRRMIAEGVTEFYEIGPGRVLKGLLKRIDRKIPCESVNDSPPS